MATTPDIEHYLLRELLDKELEAFHESLRKENPGLSDGEIERYMRAARKFASQLTGAKPRTRGRKARKTRA